MAGNSKKSVEEIKLESRQLRGGLRAELETDSDEFSGSDAQLLKFHGLYQQQDRDERRIAKLLGGSRETTFMARARIAGGLLTARQFLALDDIAARYATQGLRLTTRQTVQFHGLLKGDLKATLQALERELITTLAACGDIGRNVMAATIPRPDGAHRLLQALARELSDALLPRTHAYHEIWLDGERATPEPDPLYGDDYLPRKFKVGIALPDDNSVDVYTQDVGLVAVLSEDSQTIEGANLLVGGGLGMTHRKPDTFARLGTPLAWIPRAGIVEAVRAVATIFRRLGNRKDRRHARLKYLVEEIGIEAFQSELEHALPFDWQPPRDLRVEYRPSLGPFPAEKERFNYGLQIPAGRVTDRGTVRLRSALRRLVQVLDRPVILSPEQNLILTELTAPETEAVRKILAAYHVPDASQLSGLSRHAVACPALPTCGLAITEAERVLPEVAKLVEAELAEFALQAEPLALRMTGCPNGCARPYSADLGLVGRSSDRYDVYVGGGLRGDQLAVLYAAEVSLSELRETIRPLLAEWASCRRDGEPLGETLTRIGRLPTRRTLLTGSKEKPVQFDFPTDNPSDALQSVVSPKT